MMKVLKIISISLSALVILFFSFGLFSPEISYTNEIKVNAKVERCFSLFTDTSLLKKWIPGLVSFTKIKGNYPAPESQWKLVVVQEGSEYVMKETIKIVKPDRQFVYLLENAVLSDMVNITFHPENDHTIIKIRNTVSGNNMLWKSLFYFFKGGLQENGQMMYNELKVMIEAEQAS